MKLSLRASGLLLSFCLCVTIFVYVSSLDKEMDEVENYERATCQILQIDSSYNKCCHFSKIASELQNLESLPPCFRGYIPLLATDMVTPIQYCRKENEVHELNCGKCSTHQIVAQSLEPAPHFLLNITHYCDFRKTRCQDKIFNHFLINSTMPCWSHPRRMIVSSPLLRHIIFSVSLLYVSLLFTFLSFLLFYKSYQTYLKEERERRDNIGYDFDF